MTTKLTRDDHVWELIDCLEDARLAARNGHPWSSNRFEHGSRLWFTWSMEWQRETQRIVDARAAIAEKRIAAAQESADMAESRFHREGEPCAGSKVGIVARVIDFLNWLTGANG